MLVAVLEMNLEVGNMCLGCSEEKEWEEEDEEEDEDEEW